MPKKVSSYATYLNFAQKYPLTAKSLSVVSDNVFAIIPHFLAFVGNLQKTTAILPFKSKMVTLVSVYLNFCGFQECFKLFDSKSDVRLNVKEPLPRPLEVSLAPQMS